MRIIILCTGNTCRSQMAHGILQSLDPTIEVLSAGTKAETRVNPIAIEVMKEINIDISQHQPTDISTYKELDFDFVITVCDGAKESCPSFSGKVKQQLHIGFTDPSKLTGTPEDIRAEFVKTRNDIERAFRELYTNRIKPLL